MYPIAILMSQKALKTKTRVKSEMTSTIGVLSTMNCSKGPICSQIHFPNSPLPTLIFFSLQTLSGQFWPMEDIGGRLEDKVPGNFHRPHLLGLERVLSSSGCVSSWLQAFVGWPSIIVPANPGRSAHEISSYCTAWLLGLVPSSPLLVPLDLKVVKDSFCY